MGKEQKAMITYVIWLCWLVSGTGGKLDLEQPRSNAAVLYIYRQREFGALPYNIFLNDKRVSALSTNRYLRLEVPAGSVVIKAQKNYLSVDKKAYFTAEPGRTYYVKAVEEVDFMVRSLLFGFVSEEQAKRDLSRIKPQEPETELNSN